MSRTIRGSLPLVAAPLVLMTNPFWDGLHNNEPADASE